MAARIHHRLVFIHPFENGNGRFSRLISDRFLLAFKCQHPRWPDHLNKEGVIRKDYIQTLKYADRSEYEPLVKLMKILEACDPTLSELFKDKFYYAFLKGDKGKALVKALIKAGANPNDVTSNGHRLLQLCVKANLKEIVKLLIDNGAEVDSVDRSGLTAFQMAVIQGNKPLADLLLSYGAKQQPPPGLGYVNYYNLYRK